MFSRIAQHRHIRQILMALILALPTTGSASTIVSMQTSLGLIDIQLFDQTAPNTVANFLNYVNSGAYDNTFIHRSIPGFVIQGGGYSWGSTSYTHIMTNPPVVNEFGASNLRGTIAMAKVAGNPNSATSEWFFNLANNSGLDSDNGGFTVFGQVIGNGMQVVDAIAALQRYYIPNDPIMTDLPLINANTLIKINHVQVVPIPTAAWLFGTGLAIAGIKSRRRA